MSDIAIRVENLSKRYRIGVQEEKQDTLVGSVLAMLKRPGQNLQRLRRLTRFANNGADEKDAMWALKDVSFEVKQGEVVGVIGRNGAGKSTLLKILSRITYPTAGRVELHGRVSSLLEVGTGFHPELTGRENVYLNGTILGMRKAEIDRKFDEIVDFSGIEKFIDTPVKRYSSGMGVRLAFAVAAHLEPEILLIDEVLAVGDAEFQKKCLGKMEEVASQGRTVLFVSHNLQIISTLTASTALLNQGQLAFFGNTSEAISEYRGFADPYQKGTIYSDAQKQTGVRRVQVFTSSGGQLHSFGQAITFEFEIVFEQKPKSGAFSFQIVDEELKPIVHLWRFDSDGIWSRDGNVTLRCVLLKPRLYMGRYSLVTHLADRGTLEHLETLQGICTLEISMDGIYHEYKWQPNTCTYLEEALWQTD